MDCREYQRLLDAIAASDGVAAESADAAAHRSACRRCARLFALLCETGTPPALHDEPFVAAVLQRTVGSTCAPAQQQLPDWADGALDPQSARLVAQHLENCTGCAALAAALRRLARDLPQLAEVVPDPEFLADVRARTRALARRPARIHEGWQHLLQRPRLAWEFATAVCLLLAPFWVLPSSPLRDMPQHALAAVQIVPADFGQATARLRPLGLEAVTWTWNNTGAPIAARAEDIGAGLTARRQVATATWPKVREHLAALGGAIPSRDPSRAALALRLLGEDLATLWRGSRAGAEPTPGGE
jgi:putative zinc finger protein